jgi:hypothetical protein
MRNRMTGAIVIVAVLAGVPAGVQAQTIFGGAGVASLWDDETFLGRGLVVAGGVAQPLGRHAAVEGELAWGRHLRDSGYLAVEGTPLVGTARLAWLFQRPESRARIFASAGAALVHSTGTLTMRSVVLGPGGRPIDGPAERRDWSLTRPAFELGTGVSIRTGSTRAMIARVDPAGGAMDLHRRRPIVTIGDRGADLDHRRRRHR